MGLGAGQALIPEMYGQAEAATNLFRKGLHFLSLDAFAPNHAQGESDHDLGNSMLANDLLELNEIKALVLPVKRL